MTREQYELGLTHAATGIDTFVAALPTGSSVENALIELVHPPSGPAQEILGKWLSAAAAIGVLETKVTFQVLPELQP